MHVGFWGFLKLCSLICDNEGKDKKKGKENKEVTKKSKHTTILIEFYV